MKHGFAAKYGFTLIEMLIVVLIIAILSAIAVPNFLEQQIRAKVSKAKVDMRTLVTGLEAYNADNNSYPIDYDEEYGTSIGWVFNDFESWKQLTTPQAYISTVPYSPFLIQGRDHHNPYDPQQEVYIYWGPASHNPQRWADISAYFAIVCAGPDNDRDFYEDIIDDLCAKQPLGMNSLYDPTNGTISNGDVIWTGHGLHN
ncbi:prepilin-type N-terminal cleavage/methylation domain-containing protein [Candidatus Sumerlaeota bacterium]|nr:prepilin-type N-terminal cleavage/methylation domain-containing protein [Candidatus Sumerlaeota bacterium]